MNHYELEACVIRAKNGSKVELLKIIEQFKPLIIKYAKSIYIKNYDFYDLMQLGYVALINAVSNYKRGRNCFASYAAASVRNSVLYCLRESSRREVYAMSLNVLMVDSSGQSSEFVENLESPDNVEEEVINAEVLKHLRKVVAKLPSQELELVIMIYYSGIPLSTYAEKKGMSYATAIRKRNRILAKLRAALE